MTVAVLDRPRHLELIDEIRAAGAGTRLMLDGDVAGGINAAREDNPRIDMCVGIGGTPEGIITACALKALGGFIQARLHPKDDEERQRAIDAGPRPRPHPRGRRPGHERQHLLRRDRRDGWAAGRRGAQGRPHHPHREHRAARQVGHDPPRLGGPPRREVALEPARQLSDLLQVRLGSKLEGGQLRAVTSSMPLSSSPSTSTRPGRSACGRSGAPGVRASRRSRCSP